MNQSPMLSIVNQLSLGFSPCPNDCFIFDALIHNKIDTEGLTFNVLMEDVEALNQKALHRGMEEANKIQLDALPRSLFNDDEV